MVEAASPLRTTRIFSGVLYTLLLALVSLIVFGVFLKISNVNGFYRATFPDMVEGTAYRPFVTRAFVPIIINFVQFFLTENTQKAVLEWISNNRLLLDLLSLYKVPISYGIEALISLILQYFSLLGFCIIFHKFAGKLFSFSERLLRLITIISTLGLLVFVNYGYIYDFPELFLCTIAFYAILSNRTLLYFLVFVLAVINKETSIVLVIPSILLFWEVPVPNIKKVAIGVFSQLSIFLLIRFLIGVRFQSNQGSMISFLLPYQLQGILDHPLYGVTAIAIFCCLPILLFRYWKSKPALITLGLISALVLFVFFLFFGMPFEYRVFYEVYTVSVLAIIHTILFGRHKQAQHTFLSSESFMNSVLLYLKKPEV